MSSHSHHDGHSHSLYEELLCHFPYAVFSVTLCLSILSFLQVITQGSITHQGAHVLFHNFHFMHIVFATTGSIITSMRFSRNWLQALLVGIVSPTFFCILSDAILPYVGGKMLGVPMHWHICFASELHNILPFLIVGVLNGLAMSKHGEGSQGTYSIFSHFIHILVSSLASIFYLVAHGFSNWYDNIGAVFVLLVMAVVVPCTLSDVVVPMAFAKAKKSNEKHTA